MNVYDFTMPIPPLAQHAAVVIGNFDAVHRGHYSLIRSAQKWAAEQGCAVAVLTFEPHPRRLFRPDDAPFRVTPLAVKLDRFKECGVDHVYVLPFNWDVAEQSAVDFIDRVLKAHLNPRAVFVGNDFHFGHNRSGSINLLRDHQMNVQALDLIQDTHHGVISATRIRGLIQSGHVEEVNELLGWSWEMRGIVQKGDQRGRELGYPTANIPLGETIHPAYGVYATWVQIAGDETWHRAATNIGIRPMFEVKTALIEAHILDYQGDLYGKTLRIKPVQKIRDEMKFDGLPKLIAQIDADCQVARHLLV